MLQIRLMLLRQGLHLLPHLFLRWKTFFGNNGSNKTHVGSMGRTVYLPTFTMNLEPNVGKYTIHGSHGKQMQQTKLTNYYEGSPKNPSVLVWSIVQYYHFVFSFEVAGWDYPSIVFCSLAISLLEKNMFSWAWLHKNSWRSSKIGSFLIPWSADRHF